MRALAASLAAFLALLSGAPSARAQDASTQGGLPPRGDLVVHGDIIHVMGAPPIERGVVVIRDGIITAVGPQGQVAEPDGVRAVHAAVVTPGLIDARSVVGLAGYLNQDQDQDQLETSEPIQPELRAIDAYDARETLVEWLRWHGVTTIHTGHAPGNLISGQTMVAKTRGDTLDEALVVQTAMVAATLGSGATVDEKGKSPGTRSKAIAMLRSEFLAAQAHARKLARAENDDDKGPPDPSLRLETLGRILDRKLPLLITAHRHHDIMAALRLADEFDIDIVLDGASEIHRVLPQVRAAGVPVFIHPTMARPGGERENMSWETAAKLKAEGIPFAFQSGYESYVPKTRVVLWEAAIAAAHGLGFDAALEALTLEPARILDLDHRIGSIEVGKDGDLALFDGDPFEYTTHVIGTVIEGELVSDEAH